MGRHAQLHALGPHLIVVVVAIDPEGVQPAGELGGGEVMVDPGYWALGIAGEHDGLEPQRLDGMLQLLDGLLGVLHGDSRRGGHTVGVLAVEVGQVGVEGSTEDSAELVVIDEPVPAQPRGWVQNGEVHAQLIHALVQQTGEMGGGAVEGVSRPHPPGGGCAPLLPPLLLGHGPPAIVGLPGVEPLNHSAAAHVLDVIQEQRGHLQDVPVGVDDGVLELSADFLGWRRIGGDHGAVLRVRV